MARGACGAVRGACGVARGAQWFMELGEVFLELEKVLAVLHMERVLVVIPNNKQILKHSEFRWIGKPMYHPSLVLLGFRWPYPTTLQQVAF